MVCISLGGLFLTSIWEDEKKFYHVIDEIILIGGVAVMIKRSWKYCRQTTDEIWQSIWYGFAGLFSLCPVDILCWIVEKSMLVTQKCFSSLLWFFLELFQQKLKFYYIVLDNIYENMKFRYFGRELWFIEIKSISIKKYGIFVLIYTVLLLVFQDYDGRNLTSNAVTGL